MNRFTASVVAVVLASGCAASPTAPSPPAATSDLRGTWSGSLSDAFNGTGTLVFTLSETGSVGALTGLTGTWSATYGDSTKNTAGTVAGALFNGVLGLSFRPASRASCAAGPFGDTVGTFGAPAVEMTAGAMRATYSLATCSGAVSGTLEARKE
jgi:uncharacterized membrane protein